MHVSVLGEVMVIVLAIGLEDRELILGQGQRIFKGDKNP
jgi:hypothetical protein